MIAHAGVLVRDPARSRSRCFSLTILAGFIGTDNPYRNIAPTLVWIIWWVGFAYVSAFVGDLWALINPWRTMFDAAAGCPRRVRPQARYP